MLYELTDTSKVMRLFEGWQETLIYSCLQRVMGKVFVTDPECPGSAMAYVGCFAFYAGEPDKELVKNMPGGFVIMVPQDKAWEACIEACFPNAKKVTRYAIKKDTQFDKDMLRNMTAELPDGYELKEIDEKIYDMCLSDRVTRDFVSSFDSKEKYLEIGRGMVILRSGRIVAGASSYTRYREGIEIEVDTAEEERRKGLATIASAALILRCLDEGLYPSWDAQNMNSVHLAEKLGYEFDHEYTAYEVMREEKALTLIHYYYPGTDPWKNIMNLPEKEAFKTAAELAAMHPDAASFGRFADFENYYPNRKKADEYVREAFIRLGGKPELMHPYSFTLTECEYLRNWFSDGEKLVLNLSDIPDDQVSFTIGDSCAQITNGTEPEVLTKEMLMRRIALSGNSAEEFLKTSLGKFAYVEVQLWYRPPGY